MRNRGFTIAEILVVLILGGLAAAIASPTLSEAFRRTATQASSDEFASAHALARSAAVRHGRTAELHISGDRYWVEVDTSSIGSGAKDTVGVVRDVGSRKVTLESDRSLLCFDARGLPTTRGSCELADATITFTSLERVDTIQITGLGRLLR